MKTRISYKKLLKSYCSVISVLVGIETFILIFKDIPDNKKELAAIINIIIFSIIFIILLLVSVKMSKIKLNIHGTNVIVKFGDLFNESGKKVIGCNEYFDSLVDEKLISSNSLNGKVIKRYISDIDDFDNKISCDLGCNNNIIQKNCKKKIGKNTKYKLGTCFKYKDYIFVAFSKFDEQYRAYLDMPDYLFCLTNFWIELNRVYNGENIVVPLLGSGITRIGNSNITKQEQLTLIIDSLKYSNLVFTHDATITIILPESLKHEIRLFNLKWGDFYYDLQN